MCWLQYALSAAVCIRTVGDTANPILAGKCGGRDSRLACGAAAGARWDMRKVLKSELRPLEIKPQEKSVWICMCGLSKNQPYCDGSHKTIGEEEDGKVYEYDAQGHRVEG